MLDLLPDLFDHYPDDLTLIQLDWRAFGAKAIFHGEVVTVSCFEDNSKVKQLLATPGAGKVLVVDGQGSMNRALLGDMIAQSAMDNGWEGVVIKGCIRDAGTINSFNVAVKALGTNPIKTAKRDLGEVNCSINIAGVEIRPGMHIYGDLNGVACSNKPLDLSVIS
ncbi:putative 4-hydroxy-4-methyl-2-oxoglutarate aldolase [Shewanella sp. WXL01]|uniref:putative 4-hydroxy-4-methyl-2-oxoglutarate aldolase n=1 Tax=Shewanella sp. WXL01 TaxID=2709721 RepID=UPI0014385CDD|nr:putative 4-hydroxy-4-methyl-2-oxoglutarate aldolase [Shewanella sp. WXL01]NKF51458.1 putative 4-hydroxy-4-methyl-2-oxoglutarate aldolase [Shewanella sp. WXL01]